MAKDYSYLEGTEFMYHTGPRDLLCKVLFADYYIGMTCATVDDPDDYVICIKGAYAPRKGNKAMKPKVYQAIWANLVAQINKGHVYSASLIKMSQKHHAGEATRSMIPPSACAFGQ